MPIPTWSVGQVLAAADVNNWFVPLAAYKTATESVTSSAVLQNDDVLFLSVAANAVYLVELALIYDGATAGDLQIGWTFPAGATHTNTVAIVLTTGAASGSDDAVLAGLTAPGVGALGAGTNCGLLWKSVLTTAGTAGTFQLQWAQLVSSATATRVFAGSYLVAQRVG